MTVIIPDFPRVMAIVRNLFRKGSTSMPLKTNPQARAWVALNSDAALPADVRPVFLVRYMTDEEHAQHAEMMKAAVNEPDNNRCAELLMKAVRIGVTGWKNFKDGDGVELPFTDQHFFDLLSDRERWEIAWQYPAAVKSTPVSLS